MIKLCARRGGEVVNAGVCKTSMQGFDSLSRLKVIQYLELRNRNLLHKLYFYIL